VHTPRRRAARKPTASAAGGPGWYQPGVTGDGFHGIIARGGKVSALFENPVVPHTVRIWLYTAASLADAETNGYNLRCKLTLDAARSSDPFDYSPTFSPDGTKLLWGDDQGVEIATVSDLSASGHTYKKAGTYTVTLTVTDAGGSQTIGVRIRVRR
jgi:PKD domain